MPETRARDLANLAGAGATSSTVAFHETARGFTLPAGTGEANQVISSDGDGTTQWKTTLSAPEITSVTSDKGVNEYDSDGDDGAVIVINGTALGNDASALTVEISTDNFVTTVQTSTISILSNGTQIQATFNGTETNYNSINAGETVKVKVTKSALQSAQSATLSGTVTGDPTFQTTSTTLSTHTGTLPATSLGSYGGQIAGGGDDSNTKLLLNFDRTGGTDIEDSSNSGGDGHKVTATNALIKASPFGDGKSAIFFNGTNDKLSIPDSDDWHYGTGAFTIELWLMTTDLSGINYIYYQGSGSTNMNEFFINTNGSIGFASYDGAYNLNIVTDAGVITTNKWHHVALVRDATPTLNLYVNGVAQSLTFNNSTSASGDLHNVGQPLLIGECGYNSSRFFSGYMDEIRIVKGSAVYTSNFTVPTSRLTAITNTKLLIHSNQNTTAGTTFTDSSSDSPASNTAHAITRSGSYHTTAHGGIAPALAWPASLKQTGSAGAYFNGSNSYIQASPVTAIGTGAFTFDFWIYPLTQTSSQAQQNILDIRGHDGSSFGNGFVMQWNKADNKLKVYDAIVGNYLGTPSTVISLNAWTHIAFVRSSSKLRLYINGVQDTGFSTGDGLANTSNYSATTYTIGNGSDGGSTNVIKGYIDSFRFSSTAQYSSNFNTALPTKIYGAYRSQDVGTIQLNSTAGTGGGALDYAELSGGTALSTYGLSLSSSGAITGTLSGLDDNSNSGGVIRIRARANADDNRVTTLGGASFTGITQNDGKAPVLFNARRYIGTNLTRNLTGLGMQSDLVWFKRRDSSASHRLSDTVTGLNGYLAPDASDQRYTDQQYINNITSDGFEVNGGTGSTVNADNGKYIAWAWKAGGAPSGTLAGSSASASLTNGVGAGTIANDATGVSDVTSITQSVNQNSGFSITKYTGGGGNTASFPHNLGGTPDWIIIKNLDEARSWVVWHKDLDNASNSDNNVYNLWLDLNAPQYNATSGQHDHGAIAGPSSTLINVRKSGTTDIGGVNQDTKGYICYAWKAVSGVSAFGSYTGQGGTPTSVTTGFQPKWVAVKNISNSASWAQWDSFRVGDATDTTVRLPIMLNEPAGESSNSSVTGLQWHSNGFSVRENWSASNTSGDTYIYMAFA